MTRRVRRKVRSGNGRLDGRIGLNRPQVPILILGFPAADASIHCRRVHKCEGSSGTQFVELIALNQIVRDLVPIAWRINTVSYTHLRAHETKANLVCRLLLEKK